MKEGVVHLSCWFWRQFAGEAASHASTTPQQAAQDLQAPPAVQLASAEPQVIPLNSTPQSLATGVG